MPEFTDEELDAYVFERVTRALQTLIRDGEAVIQICPQCVADACSRLEEPTPQDKIRANAIESLRRTMGTLGAV